MLINLIIIYIACGSPFGIYRIASVRRFRSPRLAAMIGAHFILWPVFATSILRRSLSDAESAERSIERQIAGIRGEMESVFRADHQTMSVFEFREIFARFAGLAMAVNASGDANSSTDLLKIAKHQNLALASACRNRRDRERLLFHQKRVRKELVDLISVTALSRPKDRTIVTLGLRLADLVHDTQAAYVLSQLLTEIAVRQPKNGGR